MQKPIQSEKVHSKWKIPFKMEKSIQNGNDHSKWKSPFKVEKSIQNGKVHAKWKSASELEVKSNYLRRSHLRSSCEVYKKTNHLKNY